MLKFTLNFKVTCLHIHGIKIGHHAIM